MTYERVQPYTKQEAEAVFTQGTSAEITNALLGVTYYVKDWRWVQTACLALLNHANTQVQWVAIQCLGHLATFHGMLDLALVLPALQAHESDPKLVSAFYNALDDIVSGIKDTSYFEENWNELPQRLKHVLIENGVFDRAGKRIGKRNFVSLQKVETRGPLSLDQELVERLKQHYAPSSPHDWQEYYDEQGRLLRLNLEDLGLVQPPADLWQFTSLQELNLGENQLSSLPAELGKLVNLESLNLGQNKFSFWPGELGQLINLQELDLSQNQLSSLPPDLGQLVHLRWLGLYQNQLSSLPAELGQLISLHTLFLHQNQLSSLPPELGQLVHLRWLVLNQNQINSLPAELSQLVNLQELDLSQNPHLRVPPPDVIQEGLPAVLAYMRALL